LTVYVDNLRNYGWVLHGQITPSCHLFTDALDLTELHSVASQIGMRREWFQNKVAAPHYDLKPDLRQAALTVGAVAVDRRTAVRIWRERRALVRATAAAGLAPPWPL
jgi:hypothetical protein